MRSYDAARLRMPGGVFLLLSSATHMTVSLPSYDFFAPRKILFGAGRRSVIGDEVKQLARRCFVISGSRSLERSGSLDALCDSLKKSGVEPLHVATQTREPLVSDVDQLVLELHQRGAAGDAVLAIGGGSAIDLGKAVAALATNRHGDSVKDFLEGVGRGLKIEQAPLPFIALPTTSGTGAEATKNSVISSESPAFKKSLRSDLMVPSVVIVDPELTLDLPPTTTAYTGMDAITQLIESYVSKRAKPIPQALCLDGLRLALSAMITAFERPEDIAARSAMSHAALLSGMALANSGLGLAHGVAAALGVTANVPHGLACAVMLPVAMRVNREVAQERFADLGRVMRSSAASCDDRNPLRRWHDDGNSTLSDIDFAVAAIDFLCDRLRIPARLSELGIQPEQLEALALGSRGNSMDGNPCEIGQTQLVELLRAMH